MTPEILPTDRWAASVAARLAVRLADPAGQRICLPTGGTPAPVYALVPAALAELGADAGAATVVLLDEYVGLAPDDPARCDRMLRTQLIERLSPPPRFVPIPVDDRPPDEAAAELDAVASEGLDLVVLGLGRNGHVGMNEPGSAADAPTRAARIEAATLRTAVEDYGAIGRPTGGITLGLQRILEAREVWLLVSGAAKADILARVLGGPIGPEIPATLLRRHPALRVIVDEAAAAAL